MRLFLSLLGLLYFIHIPHVDSQQLNQTIRGQIVDQISKSPLIGASVSVLGFEPAKGAVTDLDGYFTISEVPLGTYTLRVSYIGYSDRLLPEIQVNSGKETVLQVTLEESISEIQEFVVTASEKDRTVNEMIGVSGRTFSVEETRKYAAAINDPARMASSFSGVVSTDDGNNNISIRGNSPNGLLWRMEGIDIPNPNHFAFPGSAGGGISILSSQLLDNSDFITGAFPAEYGNALGGVFDLNLRKGNNQKREYTIQAGFLGTDVALEGPFSENYRGSYLVNYRYSTLSLLGKIGVPLGDYVTNFQDLSFNFYLPTGKKSSVSVFGFGGKSDQNKDAELDATEWDFEEDRYNTNFFSNTGAVGVKYNLNVNSKHFLQATVLASGTELGDAYDFVDDEYIPEERFYQRLSNSKITWNMVLNSKLSSRASLRSGFYFNQLSYNQYNRAYDQDLDQVVKHVDSKGNSQNVQAFSQLNYKASERLSLNMGLHYLQFMLNNSNSLEPRFSANYQLDEKQRLSFGYGLHSQVQTLGTYFAEQEVDGNITLPNKDLGLSKSHHLVLGYDRSLNPYLRFKVETYYQHLYQIPIKEGETETYSILNQQWTLMTDPLVNKGFGKNYGLEVTLEQFTNKGMYFLFTGSIYNSLYKTEQNVWRDTRYNGNYNFTFTGGKEFQWKNNRVFGVNVRMNYGGGQRITPIDLAASIEKGEAVYQENHAYEVQNPAYFRTDLRISLKKNKLKSTRTWSLDLQNATNRKNVYGTYFEPMSNEIETVYLTPLIPVLNYRIEF